MIQTLKLNNRDHRNSPNWFLDQGKKFSLHIRHLSAPKVKRLLDLGLLLQLTLRSSPFMQSITYSIFLILQNIRMFFYLLILSYAALRMLHQNEYPCKNSYQSFMNDNETVWSNIITSNVCLLPF